MSEQKTPVNRIMEKMVVMENLLQEVKLDWKITTLYIHPEFYPQLFTNTNTDFAFLPKDSFHGKKVVVTNAVKTFEFGFSEYPQD